MSQYHILLIDDDSDDREILSMALQQINPEITVSEAENGLQGLSMLSEEQERYDLIFWTLICLL